MDLVQQVNNTLDKFLNLTGTLDFHAGEYVPNVFIIDSGCLADEGATMYNAVNRLIEQATDDTGHGTAIHNIIHYINPQSNIYHIKAMSDNKSNAEIIDNAFTYLRTLQRNGTSIDIVCCSFGSDTIINNKTLITIRRLTKEGSLIFSSIGNENKNQVYTPAILPEVICVGGLSAENDEFNKKWAFSNYSRITDVMALAEDINVPNSDIVVEGTSFANAIVVGQVSKLMTVYSKLKKADIQDRLMNIDTVADLYTAHGYLLMAE